MAAASSSTPSNLELFNEQGYLVVKKVLSQEVRRTLCKAVLDRVIYTVFGEGVDMTGISLRDTVAMLTDEKLRVKLLGAKGAKIVYRGGNSRKPLLSKSTGMTDAHYIPEVLEHVAFSETLHRIASELYGTDQLAFIAGIERVCLKAPGATKMDKHIDKNLFDEQVNYPQRIQCLVLGSASTTDPIEQVGGLCLLVNFHWYWELAKILFYPRGGRVPFPDVPASYSRFFVLPKGRTQGFDSHYLPALERCIRGYMEFQIDQIERSEFATLYSRIWKRGVRIPTEYKSLQWVSIQMDPGDAVFWKQEIPHFSNANKTTIPRVCFYYSAFPVEPEWYQSEACQWVVDQVRQFRFSYGIEADRYPTNAHNPEEIEYFKHHPEVARKVRALIEGTPLSRMLCGLSAGPDRTAEDPQEDI